MDYNLPGSFVHGIYQANILEWIVISFSRGSSQSWDQTHVSCIAGVFFTNWATKEALRHWGFGLNEFWLLSVLKFYVSLVILNDQSVKWKWKLWSLSCIWLCDPTDCSLPGSSVHGDSPGKNMGVSCHFLLKGIFLHQGSNPHFLCLLHCRQILYHLSHL